MDIDGITLTHEVKHGLQPWTMRILAADLFGKPLVDIVRAQSFYLPCFILFGGGDSHIGNIHKKYLDCKNRVLDLPCSL